MQINLKKIKGREIIEFLNKAEDHIPDDFDELYGCDLFYEKENVNDSRYALTFDIEHGHYIRGNKIYITQDGKVSVDLNEPFDGSGMEEEIELVMNQFVANLRNQKIDD